MLKDEKYVKELTRLFKAVMPWLYISLHFKRKVYQKMETNNIIEKLNSRAEALLEQFQALRSENEMLRNELVTAKGLNEAKDVTIKKLEDDIAMKEMEVEEIVSKIENILN